MTALRYFAMIFLIAIVTNNSMSQNLSLIGGHYLSNGDVVDQIYDEIVIGDYIYTTGKIISGSFEVKFEVAKWDKDGNLIQNALFDWPNFYTKNTIINNQGNFVVLLGIDISDNGAIIEFNQDLEIVDFIDQLDFMEDIVQLANGKYVTCGGKYLFQISSDLSTIEKTTSIETGGYLDMERLILKDNKLLTFSEFEWTNNVSTPWPTKPANVWARDILIFEINIDLSISSINNINRYGGSSIERINSRRHNDPRRDHIIPLDNGGYIFSSYTNSINGDIIDSESGTWPGHTWLVRLNSDYSINWSNKLSGNCDGFSDLEILDGNKLLAVAEKKPTENFLGQEIDCDCSASAAWSGEINLSDGQVVESEAMDGNGRDYFTNISKVSDNLILFGHTGSAGSSSNSQDIFDNSDVTNDYIFIAGYEYNFSLVDNDNDGYTSDQDCDDNNPDIHPGAAEICNGIDDNCDGQIDEGVLLIFYLDADNDGFGDIDNFLEACVAPNGYVSNSSDCDDNNDQINPNANEIPDNGIDEDCDGVDGGDGEYPSKSITYASEIDPITGKPIHLGEKVQLEGVVHGWNSLLPERLNFSIIDNNGEGIWIYEPFYFLERPEQGDLIKIKGKISEFNGRTQLSEISGAIQIISSNNTLILPTETIFLDESFEGELVILKNVYLKDSSVWNNNSSFNFIVTDGQNENTIRVDRSKFGVSTISQPTGSFNIVGLVDQFDTTEPYSSGYQLLPRDDEDIFYLSTNTTSIADESTLKIFPNPSSQYIYINGKPSNKPAYLKNIGGQILMITFEGKLDVSSLPSGIYFICIGNSIHKIIKL